ncbi:MAG: hypothetical protein A2Z34_04225 [Planctomycetes bacterium RBG_16_59_8]|nr:MAG: hypothetical protein A2Z34_04225 [Planctomycetes bacterium RBG_16_59_8]
MKNGKEGNGRSRREWPVMQITQIEFRKGTGNKWAHGLQRQWNTSMYMCDGYLGGKIFRCCENPDRFIIYTEWESHKHLNNYMFKEEYKWFRITDTDDDVINVLYERYELDQDCCDPAMMVGIDEWRSDLRKLGFPASEGYYRKERSAANALLPIKGGKQGMVRK